jgi:hypothetical protein
MTRLVRQIPELLTLLRGMLAAAKAVSFILLFLLLCLYVFAIVFTAQIGDHDALEHKQDKPYYERDTDPTAIELFGSMWDSMMTLFTRGILGDNLAETLEAIKDRGGDLKCGEEDASLKQPGAEEAECNRVGGSIFLEWVFIVFMIISAFCLLNMLIGVLCEVIQNSSEREKNRAELNELERSMANAFDEIDSAGMKDGKVTSVEFGNMRDNKAVRRSMAALGVEDDNIEQRLAQIQESLFDAHDDDVLGATPTDPNRLVALDFRELMNKVKLIRPDTPASTLDIEILRVRVEREEKMVDKRLSVVEEAVKQYLNDWQLDPSGKINDSKDAKIARWLREVPTEVLFDVLDSRSALGRQLKAPNAYEAEKVNTVTRSMLGC